jgi:4-amino-4-deoxy-L-arabinose transferase-like glycosyltransferase
MSEPDVKNPAASVESEDTLVDPKPHIAADASGAAQGAVGAAGAAGAAPPAAGATGAALVEATAPPAPVEIPRKEADPVVAAIYPRTEMIPPRTLHSLVVLILCAGIYVPVMGSYGMFDPWETHYTEVARQFMVRGEWLSTYWHNGKGPEGYSETNFWSKPVGSFWMSGLSLKLFGYSGNTPGEQIARGPVEWAVRLPFFLSGLFGIFCIYLMTARLFSRRAGLIATVVLATAPMYFQITRQAMTDMPYVGPMSGGIALLMLALFGEREELRVKGLRLGRRTIPIPWAPSYLLFVAAFVAFMTLQLVAIARPLLRVPLPFGIVGRPISAAIALLIYLVTSVAFLLLSLRTRTKNEVYLYTFYMAVGVAGLSKGLIGALQPGLIILVYIITSREWRILTEVALTRGLLVAVSIFCPWYHGMVAKYGLSFWNEFFGTEQFRRLTIGEQAQAKGTFEYYIGQIGYGLFPLVAFLPVAFVRAFTIREGERDGKDRARLFLCVWFAASVSLFTLTLTKYHHYILPAIPPAAILIALFLDDLVEKRVQGLVISLLASLGVLSLVAFDLVKQPAQWVWMYTYLYDSNWAQGVPGPMPILIWGAATAAAMLLLFIPRVRKVGVLAVVLVSLVGGGYVDNWYQLKVAPHWSQKSAIATYYKLRKSSEEELIAWQFNWRGETWYTAAEVVVSKSLDNAAIVAYLKERPNRRFFFITERARFGALRGILPTKKGQDSLTIVDDTNIHYVLAAASL